MQERRVTGPKARKREWRKFLAKGSSATKLLVSERPAAKKLAVSCRRREKEQRVFASRF